MAAITTSTQSISTTSQADSMPAKTLMSVCASALRTSSYLVLSAITTMLGSNSRACSISSWALEPATSTSAQKRSECRRMTLSVCVPMEPVEPSIAICFICEGVLVEGSVPSVLPFYKIAGVDRLTILSHLEMEPDFFLAFEGGQLHNSLACHHFVADSLEQFAFASIE